MENKIKQFISFYVNEYSKKNVTLTKWKEPLVAFAAADNPMFLSLKNIINATHLLPSDLLKTAQTVICYFVPFQENVANSNLDGKLSSKEWAIAYIETNKLISEINLYLKLELEKLGFEASACPGSLNFDKEKLISDWSLRHVAYITGLGTFGLNNMLITQGGCCGRIGSIVTSLKIDPTKVKDIENCLYKFNGSCKLCIKACVNDALTVEKFDRKRCFEMCMKNEKLNENIGFCNVCGKCLVGLPCSFTNPTKRSSNKTSIVNLD